MTDRQHLREAIVTAVNAHRCDDHRCSRVPQLNEGAADAILAAVDAYVLDLIGGFEEIPNKSLLQQGIVQERNQLRRELRERLVKGEQQ